MSKSIFDRLNRATRARDLIAGRRPRQVSFKPAAAKVKPLRSGRPRQVAQLLSVLEVALFTQELASEAKSNLELHGMSADDHRSRS